MTKRLIKLLKEPSTYAGFAVLLSGMGIYGLSEDAWTQLFSGVAMIFGFLAMVVLDPGDKDDD